MKKRINILYLILTAVTFGATIVSSFVFFTRANTNSAEVAAEQIKTYRQKNNDLAYATISANDQSSIGAKTLNFFIGKTVRETSYIHSNKIFLTSTAESYGALGIRLSTTEFVKPNLMILPTVTVAHDYFDIPLIAGEYRRINEAPESSYYISQSLADKIIEKQTIAATDYEGLIDKKITTNCSMFFGDSYFIGFSILGVLDDSHPNVGYYKEILGENLCITPYNSIHYYFHSVYYVFQIGKVQSADSAFIESVEREIKRASSGDSQYTFKVEFYEKDENGEFVLGTINNAYIAVNEYIKGQSGAADLQTVLEETIFVALVCILILFLIILLFRYAGRLIRISTIESKVCLGLFFSIFIAISFIMFSSRGLYIGNGLYVPYYGKTQAVSVLFVFGVFIALYFTIGNVFLIVKKNKNHEIIDKK